MVRVKMTPLRRKTAESLRHWLREEAPPPHSILPSHDELCQRFGVSLNTLRGALDILEQEQMIYRRHRSGTFVADSVRPDPAHTTGLKCITFVRDRPQPEPSFEEDYLGGYTDALEGFDIKSRFVTIPYDASRVDAVLSPRHARPEQACLLVNIGDRTRLVKWLVANKVVFVVQSYGGYQIDGMPDHHRVFANKMGAAMDAVQYLLGLGHRRVGFLGRTEMGEADEQFHGYIAAMRAAGLHPRPRDLLDIMSDDALEVFDPATEYLKRPGRPTAVFTKTDAIARAVIAASRKLGIRIPQDLSLVGYGNLPADVATEPPMTAVDVPRRTIARTAVELLLEAARGEFSSPQTRMLPCRLVIRSSTAPPASNP